MAKYLVNGSYLFHGKDNLFTGQFEIDDKIITGFISDPSSTCPRHDVEGNLEYVSDREILNFVKKPTGTSMPDVFYQLEKADRKKGITGEYEGFWSFGDQKIIGNLAIGHKPGIGEAVMVIPESEKKNEARIKLTEMDI